MIEYNSINRDERGLSVRGKLNRMLRSLILENDGVNSAWRTIRDILNKQDSFEELSLLQYAELKEQILKTFDYTDVTASDLVVYINAMKGGIAGFADSTEYDPKIPLSEGATIVALGPGVYRYFLDINGNPITIEYPQSFTIFYKAENVSYWNHKTQNLEVVIDENVDGGTAFTRYGGSKVVDGGNAEGR